MADIFDRINPGGAAPSTSTNRSGGGGRSAGGGDIFDRINPQSSSSYQSSLAPKPGNPVSRMVGGFVEMVNPFPMLGQMWDSFKQGKDPWGDVVHGIAEGHKQEFREAGNVIKSNPNPTPSLGTSIEAMGHVLAGSTPLVGPAAADIADEYATGDPLRAVGKTAGILSPFRFFKGGTKSAAGVVADATASKAGPILETAARDQYAKALRPTGMRNRQLAKDVVAPEALRRGITGSSPQDLARKATGGKVDAVAGIEAGEQAILNRETAAHVNSRITGNPPTVPVQLTPVQPILDWLETLRQGGNSQGPTTVNKVVVNPVKDAAITKYQNILREMAEKDFFGQHNNAPPPPSPAASPTAPGGMWTSTAVVPGSPRPVALAGPPVPNPNAAISEGALLQLRRALDEQIQGKHTVIPGTDTTAPLSVTRPLSNHLRELFNSSHPDLAQAFRDFRFFKTFETLANRADIGRTGLTGWTETLGTLGTGIGHFLYSHNPLEAGAAMGAFNLLYRASRSTGWRTMSAVTKHRLADAMANGRFTQMVEIMNAAGVGAGAADQGSQPSQSTPFQPHQ